MKTEDETKQYYLVLLISFIFLIISFLVLAFPKVEEKNYKNNNRISFLSKPKNEDILVNYTSLESVEKKNKVHSVISKEPDLTEVSLKNEDINYTYLNYGSKSETKTASHIKDEYGDVICKYANMYGLDCNLVIALATQERKSGHSTKIDASGAVGIMQIQYNTWVGHKIKSYNYETGSYEIVMIDDSLRTLEGNIKAGCMILKNEIEKYNYNIIAGLQAYNYGGNRVDKVIQYYAEKENKNYGEVIDSIDVGWLKYRNDIVSGGDSNYVENVLRWYQGDGVIKVLKPNMEEVKINLKNAD